MRFGGLIQTRLRCDVWLIKLTICYPAEDRSWVVATLQGRTYFQSDTVTRQGRAHSERMSDPVVTLMGGGGVEQQEEAAPAQVVVILIPAGGREQWWLRTLTECHSARRRFHIYFTVDISMTQSVLQVVMFPPEVQAAIETVLPSEDPLDSPDLDVVTYINKMFPTEASLAGLEDSMSCLQLQVTLF